MAARALDVDRVGAYRILRAAPGEGALSFVAREEGPVGFERDVVLKIVAEADAANADTAKELAREAGIGSRLNHPNIVRTHDFFARDGRLVLVMEHTDGMTLAELMAALRTRSERLYDPTALYIGVAVLDALAHAHAQMDAGGVRAPIVHGRLDPSRVLLGRDGSVKLGGFGRGSGPRPAAASAADPALAHVPGSPGEDEKSDVRDAGVLLWEMLTGRDAAAGIEPLSVVRSDLPRELSAAVGAALDVLHAKRAIGCAEVASWIKKVARFASGRDELRTRVLMLAPVAEPEPALLDESGESARVPLTGWSVRLAPIASKVLSVGTGLPRLDAAARRRFAALYALVAARWPGLDALLQRHRRASIAAAAGVTLVVAVAATVSLFSREKPSSPPIAAVTASAKEGARIVPSAPSPPTYPEFLASPAAAPTADKLATPPALARTAALHADTPRTIAPAEDKPTAGSRGAAAAQGKTSYAVPNASSKPTPPPPKGFGFLTVHSSIGYAYVYVQLVRYGRVERRLTVRCGKRFLSVGNPKPGGGEPTWFAPSRTVDIPCGGALEVTMMPKWIP